MTCIMRTEAAETIITIRFKDDSPAKLMNMNTIQVMLAADAATKNTTPMTMEHVSPVAMFLAIIALKENAARII